MRTIGAVVFIAVLCLTACICNGYASDDVVHDFLLNKNRWKYSLENDARLQLRIGDTKLILKIVDAPAGAFTDIQLYTLGWKIEKGQKYILKFNGTSNRKAQVICNFHKPSPPWDAYQKDSVTFDLSSGDNMKEEELTASESTDRARLTLYLGQNERDTEITINSLKLYKVNDAGPIK